MRTLRLRFVPSIGATEPAAVAIGNVGLWLVARPSNEPAVIRRLARVSYERWLTAYRLTGLFVIATYGYRELFARFVVPAHDYTVSEVRRPTDTTIDVSLEPVLDRLAFVPGQFVVLSFGGAAGRDDQSSRRRPLRVDLHVWTSAHGESARRRLPRSRDFCKPGPLGTVRDSLMESANRLNRARGTDHANSHSRVGVQFGALTPLR
jgi:hypothetical protein